MSQNIRYFHDYGWIHLFASVATALLTYKTILDFRDNRGNLILPLVVAAQIFTLCVYYTKFSLLDIDFAKLKPCSDNTPNKTNTEREYGPTPF